MLPHDLINGLIELFAGGLLCLNIHRLYKDKEVRGISVVAMTFYAIWGFWNLYFYPAVNAPLSFWGGILVVIANTVWVCQMIYYKRREDRRYGKPR